MTSFSSRSQRTLERRTHTRLDVEIPARLVSGPAALDGRIENIAARGAAFVTSQMEPLIPIGSQATLVAARTVDTVPKLEVQCRVARVEEYFDGTDDLRAYALQFDRAIDV